MKLPRDLSGNDLAKLLSRFDYNVVRQTGSHIRLTRLTPEGEFHLTIPAHKELKVGTLADILKEAASQLEVEYKEFLKQVFEN